MMEWRQRGAGMGEAEQALPAPMRVLVVDDERNIRKTLVVVLQGLGCAVTEAATSEAALEALGRSAFDLAFVALRLGKEDGLELLPKLLAARPGLDVVMITAYAAVDSAVEAIRRGAKDYLPKPFTPAQIRRVVEQARARRELELRVADLQERLADAAPEPSLELAGAAMRPLMEVISRAAVHDVPVLLRGESGTGKSVLARTLHELSPRKRHPFAVVKCPPRFRPSCCASSRTSSSNGSARPGRGRPTCASSPRRTATWTRPCRPVI